MPLRMPRFLYLPAVAFGMVLKHPGFWNRLQDSMQAMIRKK